MSNQYNWETAPDSWHIVCRRAFSSPDVRFGPFEQPEEAIEFINKYGLNAGVERTLRPETFDGMESLPDWVWL